MRNQGFTLLEMLIVIGVIAILGSIFGMELMGQVRNARVREAAQTLATQIQGLKSAAVKTSQGASLVWSTVDPKTYTLTRAGASTNYTLPNSARVSCIAVAPIACPTNNTLSFLAPAGESSTGLVLMVESTNGTANPVFIKVVGLTGKVVLSASQN